MTGDFLFIHNMRVYTGENKMWTSRILGVEMYHLIGYFIIYSILGWFAESVYMSFCNKKVTNRGFVTSPFCPIYGFGGLGCVLILSQLSNHPIRLYIAGAVLATTFEFLVAKLMLKIFGEVWWDYHDKPYNYQGIVCLESTVAWGFYAVFIVKFLNHYILKRMNELSMESGIFLIRIVLVVVSIDFMIHLLIALGINIRVYRDRVLEKYDNFKARWY